MIRAANTPILAWIVLAFFAAGCAKERDYLDVMNEQQDAWRELTEVLKTVKDAETMTKAKTWLDENAARFAEISRKANALPKPPPAKVQERMQEQSFVMNRTLEHLQTEVGRVGRLPGGAEFLKQFESTKGLLSAVQP